MSHDVSEWRRTHDFGSSQRQAFMTEVADFFCPKCTPGYKLVRGRAEPPHATRTIHCKVCKESLPPTDGDYALKYFLVDKTKKHNGVDLRMKHSRGRPTAVQDTAPKYLIRANDRAFGAAFKARVGAMGIRDRPTSFCSPRQNGLVEHLIGSAGREWMDQVIVFNEHHLRRILSKYAGYYNEVRTHLALGKDAPCTRPIERFGDIIAQPMLGGLHHRYARI